MNSNNIKNWDLNILYKSNLNDIKTSLIILKNS